MTNPKIMESPRDEAFRKIGRNVVNFQKLEALMKILVLYSRVAGKPGNAEANRLSKKRRMRKSPLGDVASKFVRNLIENRGVDSEELDFSEGSVSFRFNLEMDPETAAKEKRELQLLVKERNRLIHQELASFNFECEQNCRSLILKLDEQNERVRNKYKQLKHISDAFYLMQKDLRTYLESDEFREVFLSEQNDT